MRSMTIFNYLLEAALWGSVLILLVMAVRALLRGKLGNRAVYAAWLLVAIRLLVPLTLPNPAMNELRPGYSVDVDARPIADQIRTRFVDACFDISRALDVGLFGGGTSKPLRELGARTSYGHTGRWVLIFWVGAGVLIGAYMIIKNERFRRRVNRDRVRALDGDALLTYHKQCVRYRCKPLPVYYVDPLPAACMVGAFKPFIAVPLSTKPEHLQLTLAHELCHHKAHDGLWGALRNLCCAVHWYNPLVWLAAHLSRTDCELACDDRVIAGMNATERIAYADALVSASEHEGTDIGVLATGTPLTGKRLKQRINSILHSDRASRWVVAVTCLVGVIALLFSFATSESDALPTITAIPEVKWEAANTSIQGEQDAIAYARRFLESPFIGCDTTDMTFSAAREDTHWRVYATQSGHALPLVLRFAYDGDIWEYDGTRVIGELPSRGWFYTHRTPTNSINEYFAAFASALLPGEKNRFVQTVVNDYRLHDMRYINTMLKNDDGDMLHMEAVQVEPVTRVLYYASGKAALAAEAVRGKTDACMLAVDSLMQTDGLSKKSIDEGTLSAAWDEQERAWSVVFTGAAQSSESDENEAQTKTRRLLVSADGRVSVAQ